MIRRWVALRCRPSPERLASREGLRSHAFPRRRSSSRCRGVRTEGRAGVPNGQTGRSATSAGNPSGAFAVGKSARRPRHGDSARCSRYSASISATSFRRRARRLPPGSRRRCRDSLRDLRAQKRRALSLDLRAASAPVRVVLTRPRLRALVFSLLFAGFGWGRLFYRPPLGDQPVIGRDGSMVLIVDGWGSAGKVWVLSRADVSGRAALHVGRTRPLFERPQKG
jgi:hypothetical protein